MPRKISSDDSQPPEDKAETPDPRVDKENAFLLYAVFCGDIARTAHALDISPVLVQALAEEHKWDQKLQPIIALKQSTRSGDVERAVNRALNFVQAHRYRLFLERVLRKLCGLSTHDLNAFLFPTELRGKTDRQRIYRSLSARALADLAAALEKAHSMTYLALNDTVTERKERKEHGSDDATAAETHVRLAAAMTAAGGGSKSIKALMVDAQLQIAQEYAEVELNPPVTEALPSEE